MTPPERRPERALWRAQGRSPGVLLRKQSRASLLARTRATA